MTTQHNYRRTKQGVKTGYVANNTSNGASGPASQIPGLSQCAETGPEERTKGRRVGIFETDSDYVKLAKQGGQKGLLWHEETNMETKPTSYRPPDWFSATPEDQEQLSPSKATSPDVEGSEGFLKSPSKGAFQPLSAPFGTDNISAWDRESDEKKSKDDNAARDMEKLSLNSNEETNKFKKTSHDKKPVPVSMSKLLSFGYMEDETKSPNDDDASSMTSEQTSTIAPEEELE